MKLTIGICTYNRKELIEKTAKSLYEIEGIENVNINVYDDCSTEYDINYLRKLYPTAKKISRNETNLGADFNTQKMYQDFLKSEDEYLFNADSDFIFNKNVLQVITNTIRILQENNKKVIFSVFNTLHHRTIEDFGQELIIKHSIGAGCAVLSRQVIELFINEIPKKYTPEIPSIDHYFCHALRKNNDSIFCTKNSYVQHLGLVGQNSFGINFDWGENFIVDTELNSRTIIEVLQQQLTDINPKQLIFSECERGNIGVRAGIKALILCFKYKLKRIMNK